MQWIIEAYGLTKRFPLVSGWKDLLGRRKLGPNVVDHVDLLVRKGELFGLVGPNGAGKTTLIKMLTTLIAPTSGSIHIAGHDIREETKVKRAIGLATSDERSFFWRLTGRQNLRFFASLHDMSGRKAKRSIDEALSQVGLQQVSDDRFHTYSTGMRQRLAIARALLTEPSVIFLDEPTKGLDPLAAKQFHKLIKDHLINDLGITVFLTSHHLREIETICHKIAIMNRGKIQGCGTMADLRNLFGPTEQYRIEVDGLEQNVASRIAECDGQIHLATQSESHTCFEFDSDHADYRLANLISEVERNRGRIRSVSCTPVSLDVIFDSVTRKSEVENSSENQFAARPIIVPNNTGNPLPEEKPTPHVAKHSDSRSSQLGLLKWIKSKARIASALAKRDMLSETSYRLSFFMQVVQIFLVVAALFFLSRLVGQNALNEYLRPYGGNYFAFAIIGVAFFGYFNVGFSIFAAKLSEAQTTGTLEAMLSTPTGLSTIVLGSSIWRFIMTTLRVLAILLSGVLIMESRMRINNYPLVFLILLLTVLSASSFGIISACFIMVVKRGDPISWLFKSTSFLLGGVVFPVTVLPLWMQKAALLLPATHALQAMRLVMLQGKSISDILPEIAALCVFCFLLLPISLRALQYSVRRAKKEGTLTHY